MRCLGYVLAIGCGARSPATAGAVHNRSALPATQPPVVTCYAGTQTASSGEVVQLVLRRSSDAEHAQITEEWTRASGGAYTVTTTIVLRVVGARFTAHEGGAEIASGILHGEPWRWTRWTAVVPTATGALIPVSTELTDGGGLRASIGVPGADGSAIQELARLDCDDFETARNRLTAGTR